MRLSNPAECWGRLTSLIRLAEPNLPNFVKLVVRNTVKRGNEKAFWELGDDNTLEHVMGAERK